MPKEGAVRRQLLLLCWLLLLLQLPYAVVGLAMAYDRQLRLQWQLQAGA